MKVAIVGGGIAGLAAAWELRGRAEVTVFEPGHLGGRIRTEPFEGAMVDCGPDAFITRVPEGLELCREAGVEDLVAPRAGATLLWWRGKLRPLPEGLVLGVPRRLGPTIRSGLLSPLGAVRAAADLVLPPSTPKGDVSVREVVARRFGAQVADRLVEPLVGSIHAGTTAELSAETTVPQLVAVARRSRSLLLGLRASAPAGPSQAGGSPVFLAPRSGMSALVDAVVVGLKEAGASFVPETVTGIRPVDGRWALDPSDCRWDAVVLALPDRQARPLVKSAAGTDVPVVPRASVVLVTLSYTGVAPPPGVNGVLVPRTDGLLTTAVSFGSSKWPHWSAPGRQVLRVSCGRYGDDRAIGLGDEALVERLAGEVGTLLSTTETPASWRVSRWPDSFPQYVVGHSERVRGLEAALPRGLAVCGSSYHGAGIPACIGSGRRAGRRLLDQ